jgi:hypothetical protein
MSMNVHGKADDSMREVFIVAGLGGHSGYSGCAVAGLAEIANGRLMDSESETLTQISGIKGTDCRESGRYRGLRLESDAPLLKPAI